LFDCFNLFSTPFSFDDLVVGASFEYHFDGNIPELGRAVYVFHSAGRRLKRGDSSERVFRPRLIILPALGGGPRAQFGAALTSLGNVDNDSGGYTNNC
jgi:hypothetical protein